MIDREKLLHAIRELRRRHFATNQDLANAIGISLSTVARWMKDEQPPRVPEWPIFPAIIQVARSHGAGDLAEPFMSAVRQRFGELFPESPPQLSEEEQEAVDALRALSREPRSYVMCMLRALRKHLADGGSPLVGKENR